MKYQEIVAFLEKKKANTTNKLYEALKELFPNLGVDKVYNETFSVSVYMSTPLELFYLFNVQGRRLRYGNGTAYTVTSSSCSYRARRRIDDSDMDVKRCLRLKAKSEALRDSPFGWSYDQNCFGTKTFAHMKAYLYDRKTKSKELDESPIPWDVRSYLDELRGKSSFDKDEFMAELPFVESRVRAIIEKHDAKLREALRLAEESVSDYLAKRKSESIF